MPPAAAPLSAGDLFRGIIGMVGVENTRKLENEMREYFGSEYVFLVSSGKAAFALILRGLSSLRPRKKVLIPAYTCYSVPSAIVKCGLEIVLCDVDPDTLDFDYDQLADLADESILCIVSTHLFGIPADVARVRGICEQKGIFLVEDAAQAMGGEDSGGKLGSLGDVGFFSLGRGKAITCGSGGIILTSTREIAESIRPFYRNLEKEPVKEYTRDIVETFFMKIFLNPYLYWLPKGLPCLGIGETRFDPVFPMYHLNPFQAGVLRSWRARMEEYNGCRERNGRFYAEELELRKAWSMYSRDLPYLRFPLYAGTPESKAEACRRFGSFGVSPMYPDSLNRIDQLREMLAGRECPGAERIAGTLITLPTHVLLKRKDLETICENMKRTHDRRGNRRCSLAG